MHIVNLAIVLKKGTGTKDLNYTNYKYKLVFVF